MMGWRKLCLAAVVVVMAAVPPLAGQGTPQPIHWALASDAASVKPGQVFHGVLTVRIDDGWHLYGLEPMESGPVSTQIDVPSGQPFSQHGAIDVADPETAFDPNFQMDVQFYENYVVFRVPVSAEAAAKPGKQLLTISATYQTCNDHMCLPPTRVKLNTPVVLLASAKAAASVASGRGSATPTREAVAATKDAAPNTSAPVASSATPPSAAVAERNTRAAAGVGVPVAAKSAVPVQSGSGPAPSSPGAFLWFAMAMGALSLLTPCVFPMVPITVSYFSNHGSTTRRGAVAQAVVYAVGIVLTFTALGVALALIFGAGGVNQLAANPWVNLLITAIFLFFAFSLFGAYFIQVPSGLMNRLDAVTRSREGSGFVGALLMGCTFTLTSFTCTAPFVGTLLVMASQGHWLWPVSGMLAYSTVFALPFFVLALAPQLLSRLPRAGGWMNSVKVVMGFLEIAAAMKFLSNADLVWGWGVFTREVVLAIWIACGTATVLYVFGLIRFEHDSPVEHIGPLRLTSALVLLAITIALVPGLFGQKLGELDSFLPPSSAELKQSTVAQASAAGEVNWILNDFDGALTQARKQNKLVFIDFTGYTCTNCRWMEANMFPRPEVSSLLAGYVTVRLYTDGDGAIYEQQQKMQQDKFGTVALPLYAIVRADGSSVATFSGLTRKPEEFVNFLQSGTQKSGS